MQLTIANNNLTVAGAISGSNSLTVNGPGSLTFTGTNTYTGGTTVSSGTLVLPGPANLANYASQGALTMDYGATLMLGSGPSGWSDASIGSLLTSNALTLNTPWTLGIDTTNGNLTSNISIPYSSVGLFKTGTGILALGGNNLFAGAVTVGQGTLQIGTGGSGEGLASSSVTLSNGTTLAFSQSDSMQYGGYISGGGQVVQMGPGTLALNGYDSYAGGTRITGGTLQLGSAYALGSGAVIANAGTLDLKGLSTVSLVSLGGSAGVVTNSSAAAAMLDLDGRTATTFSGAIRDGIGPIGLQLDGTVLTLGGTNAYTGPTILNNGALIAQAAHALAPNSPLTINYGALAVTAGNQSIAANVTLGTASSPISITGSGSLNISGSVVDGDEGNASLTLSSSDGTGLLTLSGSNSYGGGTTVSSGTLVLDGAASLLAGSSLTIGSTTAGDVFSAPLAAHAAPALAPVPEPDSLALLLAAAGLAGFSVWSRKPKASE